MPGADVEELHRSEPEFILPTAAALQGEIDAQLRKRFPAPYSNPAPRVVLGWLGILLTFELYEKRGCNPSEPAEVQARRWEAAQSVREILQQVADGVDSRWDLELRGDSTASGNRSPMPDGYSEQSPYTSKHKQFDSVRNNRRYG